MPPTQHPFIDMHTHLFTARYLPLHGIFRSFGVPSLLARGLARLCYAITGESRFDVTGQDPDKPDRLIKALLDQDADAMMAGLSRPVRALLRRASREFKMVTLDPETRDMVQAIDDIAGGLGRPVPLLDDMPRKLAVAEPGAKSGFEGGAADDLDQLLTEALTVAGAALKEADFLHSVVHLHFHEGFVKGRDKTLRGLGLDDKQLGSLRQILLFIVIMTLTERARYAVLDRDYAEGKPADGQDAYHYIGVLMDMTGAYDSRFGRRLMRPRIGFKSQMDRMAALSRETGGRLISFGAVDPFRADWQSYVDHGVQAGAKGFKIYCPLGYRPTEVPGYVTPVAPEAKQAYRDVAAAPVPDQAAQARMPAILEYFSANDLRLYTHCTGMGFQARTGFGVYGDPHLWDAAMNRPETRDLWLFLAHGGGATEVDFGGWGIADSAGDPDADFWSKTFAGRAVRMAETYPNVYLGSAFFDMLDADPATRVRITARFKRLLTTVRPDTRYHLRHKLCFGTDWSMPEAIGRTRDLLNAYYDLFDDPDLRDMAPGFFDANARRYLGLPARRQVIAN